MSRDVERPTPETLSRPLRLPPETPMSAWPFAAVTTAAAGAAEIAAAVISRAERVAAVTAASWGLGPPAAV
ncbi:MAG: hypothetical protein H6R20_1669 [Proteobacteria bacterium]|jgi:hypothetical protein|nr:hypothetical protein [Pseudomonadota bacterium]